MHWLTRTISQQLADIQPTIGGCGGLLWAFVSSFSLTFMVNLQSFQYFSLPIFSIFYLLYLLSAHIWHVGHNVLLSQVFLDNLL